MKKVRFLFITCLAAFTMSSCSEDEPVVELPKSSAVKFDASIENAATRASGTTWDAADAIGVYMKTAGGNLTTTAISGAENVKYTTVGGTNTIFTAATTGIKFPEDGSNVDFISYYPYQTTINSYTYPVDVSNQTDLSKIDLLYSNNATNANKTNSTVDLNFKHMLSQLVLNITAGDGVSSLNGLNLSIEGLKTDGNFNLASGEVTLGTTQTKLTYVINNNTNAVTVNSIVVPKQDLNTAKLVFTLNGKAYNWVPDSKMLESGKKYTYPIQLTTTGLVILNPSGSIEDWVEGNPGGSNVILTPSDDPVFTTDKTNVALAAAASSSGVIQLTTQNDQAWTTTSSEPWLTVSPASGTGNQQITLTATTENSGAERTATVTLTPTGGGTLLPVTITVVQAAGTPTPSQNLLFPGSDFNDWNTFLSSLNSYGLISTGYAVHNATGGRDGSGALHLNGIPIGNDYVFTALVPAGGLSATPSKITFYIKGTSAKSLSLNVYIPDVNYIPFNLGDCTSDTTVESAIQNNYNGTINTSGQWVKVTLNVAGLNLLTTAGSNLFALKVGKEVSYDLLVDDITFE